MILKSKVSKNTLSKKSRLQSCSLDDKGETELRRLQLRATPFDLALLYKANWQLVFDDQMTVIRVPGPFLQVSSDGCAGLIAVLEDRNGTFAIIRRQVHRLFAHRGFDFFLLEAKNYFNSDRQEV